MQQTKYQRIHHGNDLKNIFLELKKLFKKYNPLLIARADDASPYDLWSTKAVEIAGRKGMAYIFLPD